MREVTESIAEALPKAAAVFAARGLDGTRMEDIVEAGFDRTTVARVIQMVDHSEYKRRQAPIGIKITHRALGKDRRMPITSGYRNL